VNGLFVAVVAVVMVAGVLGTIVPLLPGLPLIWVAAVAYGLAVGFDALGWAAIAALTALAVAGMVAKLVLPQRRSSAAGTPRSSQIAGAAAGAVGFFVLPVVGLVVGAVAGVMLAEYRRTRSWGGAWRSTKATIVGFGLGALVELTAGAAMVATWALWVLLRT
jgi:uncharacterized protein YqgC (DUF456 family)